MLRSLFRTALLLLACATSLPSLGQSMDCSALDPRKSVSSQVDGKVSASATTLYKVAQAGGGIEGRIRNEATNLELDSSASERAIIKPRLIYLFCQMISNSKDFTGERRLDLFMQLQRSLLAESVVAPASAQKVRVQFINNLGTGQRAEVVEIYSGNQLLARLSVRRGATETAFASVMLSDASPTTYSLVGFTTLENDDGSTRTVSISGSGRLNPEQDDAYYVTIREVLSNRHVLYLKRE